MSSIRGIVKDIIIVAVVVAVIWAGIAFGFGVTDSFPYSPLYVVASGSMYPDLAMHDVIVISGHVLFEDVKIGDIIVFDRPKDHDKVIVHRVVAVVDDDPLTLRTKGDNNQNSIVGTDYPITEEEYKGTVIRIGDIFGTGQTHVIPQVGYITKILQPPINYIIIAVIIGIMIIRQIAKNKAGKHYEQVKVEPEKIEADSSWLDDYKNASKDFPTQEKKSEENTKSEGIPEFFLDREKESEEKK